MVIWEERVCVPAGRMEPAPAFFFFFFLLSGAMFSVRIPSLSYYPTYIYIYINISLRRGVCGIKIYMCFCRGWEYTVRMHVTSNYRSCGRKILQVGEDRAIRRFQEGREPGSGQRSGIPFPDAAENPPLDVSQLGRQQPDLILMHVFQQYVLYVYIDIIHIYM